MSDTLGNFDAQYDELAALSAIFGDDALEFSPFDTASGDDDGSSDVSGWHGHMLIKPPMPLGTLDVSFRVGRAHEADAPVEGRGMTVVTVASLPPIEVHFTLPAGYPTTHGPHIQVLSEWAPSSLLAEMTGAAERAAHACLATKSVALFDVHDAVVQVLSQHLQLATQSGDGRNPFQLESKAALQLAHQHDQASKAATLAEQPYTCLICLDTRPAELAIALPSCQHRFCRTCIAEFFTTLINEGMSKQVRCPHPDCAPQPPAAPPAPENSLSVLLKDPSADVDEELQSATRLLSTHPIQPAFLHSLLGESLTSKWTTHFLSRAYAADPSMHWCPIPACGGPARGHLEGTYTKLATCLRCQFSFCVHCSRAYHGSAQTCKLEDVEGVMDAYLAAMDAPTRAVRDAQLAPLYVKYERSVVESLARERERAEVNEAYMTMVDRLQQVDVSTRTWVREHATACPKCGVRVMREGGCAHMTCAICGESFCDHCGEVLAGGQVGAHYSNRATGCYGRLYG